MSELDPSPFISAIENCCCFKTNDEVEVRRCVSTLFFLVFNYWAEKTNVQKGNSIKYIQMENSFRTYTTINNIKTPITELMQLQIYRTVADHYLGNNRSFNLYLGNPLYLSFDLNLQRTALEKAKVIISFLDNAKDLE